MRSIKLKQPSRKLDVEQEVDNLATIGNWAKSCTTIEQLIVVDKFLDKHCTRMRWRSTELSVLHYHLGIVDGIILSLKKHLKIK